MCPSTEYNDLTVNFLQSSHDRFSMEFVHCSELRPVIFNKIFSTNPHTFTTFQPQCKYKYKTKITASKSIVEIKL